MNKLINLAALTCLALGTVACNESTPNDVGDAAASRAAVAKDEAAIDRTENSIEAQRAAKARAKATGDTLGQAKSSVAIGAHQTKRAWKEGEKAVDEKILEQDEYNVRN